MQEAHRERWYGSAFVTPDIETVRQLLRRLTALPYPKPPVEDSDSETPANRTFRQTVWSTINSFCDGKETTLRCLQTRALEACNLWDSGFNKGQMGLTLIDLMDPSARQ